jgi:hypothetical protein
VAAVDAAFEIGGRLRLGVRGLSPDEHGAIRRHLDPCPATPLESPPDVLVEVDGHVPAALLDMQRDAGDGRLTATDGQSFYVVEQGRACAIPPPGGAASARFAVEPGFPIARAFGRLVRPTLQIGLLARDAAAAHSAAVEIDGRAVLVAGWSESGKTETALALVEDGARFLSDKWTVVGSDGTACVFPIGVGVRGWVLRHLPRLDAALGRGPRGRLRAAALTRAVSRPLDRGPLGGPLERLITLADRISLAPSQLRRLYGHDPAGPWHAPLAAVALLTTVPDHGGVRAQLAEPTWAAARLSLTADFERRGIFELHDRARWALRDRDPDLRHSVAAAERELFQSVLAAVPVIDVRAPFPTDPRPVADAIARLL